MTHVNYGHIGNETENSRVHIKENVEISSDYIYSTPSTGANQDGNRDLVDQEYKRPV